MDVGPEAPTAQAGQNAALVFRWVDGSRYGRSAMITEFLTWVVSSVPWWIRLSLTVFFFVLWPGLVFEASNARPYAIAILLVVASALALVRWLDRPTVGLDGPGRRSR